MTRKLHSCASSWAICLYLLGLCVTTEGATNATNGTSTTNTTDVCNIQCKHNTTCAQGNASFASHLKPNGEPFEFHQDTSINGYYCDCPPGLTGVDCGRSFVTCEYSSSDNEDWKVVNCYHGGQCLLSIDDLPISGQYHCDCSTANYNGKMYMGNYCEQEVEKAKLCPAGEGSYFCLNGGTCQVDNPEQPCECTDEYTGPHCEYKNETPSKAPETKEPTKPQTNSSPETETKEPTPPQTNPSYDNVCDLECKNGGICSSKDPANAKWGSREGMYCECPDNYAGLQCEYPAEVCGQGDLVCLYGSSCVKGGNAEYKCDRSRKKIEHCNPINFPEYSIGMAVPAFCVNGGSCVERVDGKHVTFGCECPDVYKGRHCEHIKTAEELDQDGIKPTSSDFDRSPVAIALIVFFCGTALVVCLLVSRQTRRRIRAQRREDEVIVNLQGFRDEQHGRRTSSGRSLFAGLQSNTFNGELLHEVNIT